MVKKFKELVLKKDTIFNESIIIETSIRCTDNKRFSLKVVGNINAWDINAGNINAWDINAWDINAGNINAWDINAWNINAGNIDAWNINAGNIDAGDINAWNINAGDIVCEKRIKKDITNKTIARIFIQNKSTIEKKEWG